MGSTAGDRPPIPSQAAGTQDATAPAIIRRNAISGYLPLLISTLLGVFLTPIFVHALSRSDFGVWSVGLGMIAYLGILDAGVGTAVVTRIGHANSDANEIERITRTASAIYVVMGLACSALACCLAFAAPAMLSGDIATTDIGMMVLFLGAWQAFNLILAVPSGALQGSGRYSSFAGYAAGSALGLALLQAGAALITHHVAAVAAVTAVGGFGALALSHIKAKQQVAGYMLSPRKAERKIARKLFSLGTQNAIVFIAGAAGYGSDIIVVGVIAGTKAAAIYTIASRAAQFAITLGRRASETMSGSYATLFGTNQVGRAWQLYLRGVQTSLTIFIPLLIVLIGFGRQLLVGWVGPIGLHSYPILVVIAISGLFQVAGYNAFSLAISSENGQRLVSVSVASAIVNLGLSVVLTAKIGAVGAAVGSLVSAALIDGLALPRIASRICGTDARSVLRHVTRLSLPTLVSVGSCILYRVSTVDTLFSALCGGMITVAAFVLGGGLTRAGRADLRRLMGRGIRSRSLLER